MEPLTLIFGGVALAFAVVALLLLLRVMAQEAQLRGVRASVRRTEAADTRRTQPIALLQTYIHEFEARIAVLDAELHHARVILAALDDAVIVVGPTEEVRTVNDAALALFPTTFVTMHGRRVIEITGDYEIAALVRDCLRTHERQEGRVELVGSGRIVRAVAVPLDTDEGTCLLLARDVTEVQHLQTVRREFVANVSHELRTPLGIIRNYIEALLDGGLEAPGLAEDWLPKMLHEVEELTQLVNELLDLSRLESGRVQPKLVPLDLASLMRDAVDRLETQAERADITLTVAAAAAALPPVIGDRQMLEGALVNLIHNAVKFTPGGGTITVGVTESDATVALWVEDTGIGIASEHLPRLFERFYKEDRARSGRGTGLGLAIVKHVALVHGGRVQVESEPGRGSRFTMFLPAVAQRALQAIAR